MTKRRSLLLVAAGLFVLVALITLPFQVGSVQGDWQEQTWPSRTPTPAGGPNPTNTPVPPPPTTDPGGGGNGGNPTATTQPQPGDTPVPGETEAATVAPTVILQTPVGGYEATAVPCGVPPTIQALGQVNIRSGPGLGYDAIDTLIYLETRPIIGRAEYGTWWQIQLPGNLIGWVANQAVTVQGYTGGVPIVDPPANPGGSTPTPGPLWDPTPNPVCTPEPTATATNTPEPTEPAPTAQTVSNSNPTQAPPPEPTDTQTPPTATATLEPAPTETASPVPEATNPAVIQEEPSDNDEDTASSTSSWILYVGIGLVIVGAATVVLRRR